MKYILFISFLILQSVLNEDEVEIVNSYNNTDELIENRGFFFTKISREKLSRKKSHSKGKNISLTFRGDNDHISKKIIF